MITAEVSKVPIMIVSALGCLGAIIPTAFKTSLTIFINNPLKLDYLKTVLEKYTVGECVSVTFLHKDIWY